MDATNLCFIFCDETEKKKFKVYECFCGILNVFNFLRTLVWAKWPMWLIMGCQAIYHAYCHPEEGTEWPCLAFDKLKTFHAGSESKCSQLPHKVLLNCFWLIQTNAPVLLSFLQIQFISLVPSFPPAPSSFSSPKIRCRFLWLENLFVLIVQFYFLRLIFAQCTCQCKFVKSTACGKWSNLVFSHTLLAQLNASFESSSGQSHFPGGWKQKLIFDTFTFGKQRAF